MNTQDQTNGEKKLSPQDILMVGDQQKFHPDSILSYADDANFNNGDPRYMAYLLNMGASAAYFKHKEFHA